MLRAQLRPLALACIAMSPQAFAQDGQTTSTVGFADAGAIYEANLRDVTLPVATYDEANENGDNAVTIPVENRVTPMQCMTAWSYLAGRIIETPERLKAQHPDFTEGTASAHWQHWLRQDIEASQGLQSADFHQRRLAAERAFSLALAEEEEAFAYRTLGACYIPPAEREVGDPTQLLRNFMIEHQGLPESFAVPVLQRQLRAFPISVSADGDNGVACENAPEAVETEILAQANLQCFDRGGILASQTMVTLEDIEGVCRATATVQCENIP